MRNPKRFFLELSGSPRKPSYAVIYTSDKQILSLVILVSEVPEGIADSNEGVWTAFKKQFVWS